MNELGYPLTQLRSVLYRVDIADWFKIERYEPREIIPKNSIITQVRTKFYNKMNTSHQVPNAKWGFFIGQTLITNECCLDPNPQAQEQWEIFNKMNSKVLM